VSRDPSDGLARLHGDVVASQLPAPELLARYANDPNSLSEEEKQRVELAMAESPMVADEFDTLRGFDFRELNADRRSASEGARARGWLASLLPAPLPAPVWLVAAAGAGALAIWLALAPTRVDEEAPPSNFAERPAIAPAPPMEPNKPSRVAAEEGPSPAHEAEVTPLAPESEGSALPPERLASEPAPGQVGVEPDAPTAGSLPAEPPSPPSDQGQGEMLLAMVMPVYQMPADAALHEPMDWVVRSGPDEERIALSVVAPSHVTRSSIPSPTLHWSLERLPSEGELYLTIVDADEEPIVLDRRLTPPTGIGLQRTALSELAIELPAKRELRWSIALRPEEEAPPLDFAMGWIEYRRPAPEWNDEVSALPEGEHAAALARAGYWHEALEATLAAIERHPDDPRPRAALQQLLEQAKPSASLPNDE
jgi:hypothetical protein